MNTALLYWTSKRMTYFFCRVVLLCQIDTLTYEVSILERPVGKKRKLVKMWL